jgi:NADH-quinone oxidoreductase subunit L
MKWWLVGETTAAAVLGIVLGYEIYQRKRLKAVEPAFLAHGWYYDEAVTAFMGGPGTEAFEATATFDAKVVDGAVEGTASGIRALALRLRRFQSGYVRSYALGIGVGAVALLGWFVVRGLA